MVSTFLQSERVVFIHTTGALQLYLPISLCFKRHVQFRMRIHNICCQQGFDNSISRDREFLFSTVFIPTPGFCQFTIQIGIDDLIGTDPGVMVIRIDLECIIRQYIITVKHESGKVSRHLQSNQNVSCNRIYKHVVEVPQAICNSTSIIQQVEDFYIGISGIHRMECEFLRRKYGKTIHQKGVLQWITIINQISI